MASKPINKKFLAGLKFRTANPFKSAVVRDLTPADVLDWKDIGSAVVIVTADGRKLKVLKGAASDAGDAGSASDDGAGDPAGDVTGAPPGDDAKGIPAEPGASEQPAGDGAQK